MKKIKIFIEFCNETKKVHNEFIIKDINKFVDQNVDKLLLNSNPNSKPVGRKPLITDPEQDNKHEFDSTNNIPVPVREGEL